MFTSTPIPGLQIFDPQIWGDDRGYFFESYNRNRFVEAGIENVFVQDNESQSSHGVLRGLHYQVGEMAQAKLVRVLMGEVLDVAVDIREGSPTFGQHYAVRLSGENKRQFFVPRGFAHGFIVLSETAVFAYKCDNFYSKNHEGGIRFDDPQLGIDWQVASDQLILSEKDQQHPTLGKHRPSGIHYA